MPAGFQNIKAGEYNRILYKHWHLNIFHLEISCKMTAEQLKHIVPGIKPANLQVYTDLLNKYMPLYEITTKARQAPFLANLAHESGSFNYTLEIDSGGRYEGRKDLGNTTVGDGPRYKGRGLIQITGHDAYYNCSMAMYKDARLLKQPELLQEPDAATESACWFWTNVKGLNQVADKPDDWVRSWDGRNWGKFEWIVLRINGGQNGLAERKEFLKRAVEVL
jgi:putative chitinase